MNVWKLWQDALDDPTGKWVVIVFALASFIIVAIYVAKWFRDLAMSGGNAPISAIDHLTDFEKLYAQGKLSREEYQQLKKAVPKSLVAEFGIQPRAEQHRSGESQPSTSLDGLVEDESPDFKPLEDP